MAHLLGSRFCIESLRSDVTDLQGAIIDVFSRVGPVRLQSWKYPDKVSADLDLTDLLETYDYSEDEEERQLAHIVLLELVIDRLVLLLQSMTKYADHLMNANSKSGQSSQQSNNTSIGLVVKKFWNKIVHLGLYVHEIQVENKNKSRMVEDLENSLSKLMDEGTVPSSTGLQYVKLPLNHADTSRLLSGTVSSASAYSISRDECIKSTQTLETAFVPCESCDLVQRHFRQVGDVVVSICNAQDLPCSLAQHKGRVEKLDWMCGTDISRWATEQSKDLTRINKHLTDLTATIGQLQKDLEKEKATNHQLTKRLSECAKELVLERETQSVQQKQYETKIKGIEVKYQDKVSQVERENTALQKNKVELQKQVDTMKKKVEEQEDIIQELESVKQQILRDMEEKMVNKDHICQLETELGTTQQQLNEVKEKLEKTKKELNREKARNKSVTKHTESLQDRQEHLIQRLDAIDLENEELRNQVLELEEQKEQLEKKLENLKDEKRQLKQQLDEEKKITRTLTLEKEKLQRTTEQLKADIQQMEQQLQEAQEQERLLVEYPDLHGPVNPDLSGTGDIVQDMENQIKANRIRIKVLEEENTKLRNSITKILVAQQSDNTQLPRQPVALWKMEDSIPNDDTSRNTNCEKGPYMEQSISHDRSDASMCGEVTPGRSVKQSTASRQITSGVRQSFVVGKGVKSSRSRPPSGKPVKTPASQTTSSINTYKQLKKAGLLKVGQPHKPSEGVTDHSEKDYQPQETFSCPKCDKMYNSPHDLQLHKSYCYGGI